MSQKSKTTLEIKRLLKVAAKYEEIILNSQPNSKKKTEAIKSRNSCMRKIMKLMARSRIGQCRRDLNKSISEGKKLSSAISDDQLGRIISVLDMAAQVFKDPESAFAWMSEPQFGFGWKKPIDLIIASEAGEERAKAILAAIRYGGVA